MTKMFCDRCGAEIKSEYAWLLHRTIYAKQKLLPSFMRTEWDDADKYLCRKCEDQYIHWFMNPEEDKEEET